MSRFKCLIHRLSLRLPSYAHIVRYVSLDKVQGGPKMAEFYTS